MFRYEDEVFGDSEPELDEESEDEVKEKQAEDWVQGQRWGRTEGPAKEAETEQLRGEKDHLNAKPMEIRTKREWPIPFWVTEWAEADSACPSDL